MKYDPAKKDAPSREEFGWDVSLPQRAKAMFVEIPSFQGFYADKFRPEVEDWRLLQHGDVISLTRKQAKALQDAVPGLVLQRTWQEGHHYCKLDTIQKHAKRVYGLLQDTGEHLQQLMGSEVVEIVWELDDIFGWSEDEVAGFPVPGSEEDDDASS